MTVPYPMLKSGHFTGTIRSGDMVLGLFNGKKGQNFTKNLKIFVTRFAIMESI